MVWMTFYYSYHEFKGDKLVCYATDIGLWEMTITDTKGKSYNLNFCYPQLKYYELRDFMLYSNLHFYCKLFTNGL